MEPGARRLSVDLTSRILSILSLGVALAGVGYLYTQDRVSGTRDQLVASFDKQLAEHAQEFTATRTRLEADYQTALDRQDARLEAWNTQLNEALTSFHKDANSLLTQIDESEQAASEARQLAFRKALDQFNSPVAPEPAGGETQLSGPANRADAADARPEITENDRKPSTALAATGNLNVVNTVLRPGTGNTTLIVIENDGTQDAQIDRIRFRPQSEFENTDSLDLATGAETPAITTIAFEKSDNTSNRPGYHGIYDRPLEQGIRVPAGERLTLRCVINDAQYEGWGFSGKLVLDYDTDESLTVDTARVAFRGSR